MSARSSVRVLTLLLSRQADSLRRGDLAGLAAMAPALDRACAVLAAQRVDPADAPELVALRQAAARVTPLVAAALAGVRSARDTLGASKSAGFTGYDASGRSARIGSTQSRIERRS